MLKVDNMIVGRTHWRQMGKEAWGQSFSTELERVSGFHFSKQLKLQLSQNCNFSNGYSTNLLLGRHKSILIIELLSLDKMKETMGLPNIPHSRY